MFDIVIETLRATITFLLVLYLWRIGKQHRLNLQKGWRYIFVGFGFILFATVLDITDNFPSLNSYIVIGKTETEAFLEKLVGYLGGCILLFIGFTQWIPLVIKLRNTEIELSNKTSELELKVKERTAELQQKNGELEREMVLLAEAQEQIRHLALYDPLTQLPNRRLLEERIQQSIISCKRSHRYAALLFLDLDNFKLLNDTYGHKAGDVLLVEVAERITSCVRASDTVARLGGDEFVILLDDLNRDVVQAGQQGGTTAEKIRTILSKLYELQITQLDGERLTITHHGSSSIGVVVFDHTVSLDKILMRADKAMYQAKNAGKNLIRWYE